MASLDLLLLLFSALFAVLVANVYIHPSRGVVRSLISFAPGTFVAELAPQWVFFVSVLTVTWLVVATSPTWQIFVGIGSNVVASILLLVHYATSFKCHVPCEHALEALGIGDSSKRHDVKIAWSRILFGLPIKPRSVERRRNLVYAIVDGRKMCVDLYRRPDGDARQPLFVYLHGGGYVVGSKYEQGLPLIYEMAKAGFLCASVAYRHSPKATFPDQLVDVKRALAWLRTQAAELGIDTRCVLICGGSAGAHLASMVALSADDPSLQPGFEDADTHVDACVAMYGFYDCSGTLWPHGGLKLLFERLVLKQTVREAEDSYRRYSPIHRVTAAAPPFLLLHGSSDSLVPLAESQAFLRQVQAVSNQAAALIVVPRAQHIFDFVPSVRTQIVVATVVRFCEWVKRR